MKSLIKRLLRSAGYTLRRTGAGVYNQDGLLTAHNHDFMGDPSFTRAYQRGVQAGGCDYHMHWRVHVALWAAHSASKLSGDFVECGVGRGFVASAIMAYLDWDSLGRTFYLLDTFTGADERYVTDTERARGILKDDYSNCYADSVDEVRENFSQWSNVQMVVGAVPESLDAVESDRVAFLHVDMNCVAPEVAALKFFWERLSPGAFVLLDDYAYRGFDLHKTALDGAAADVGDSRIVALPTGQGLLIKPAWVRAGAYNSASDAPYRERTDDGEPSQPEH